MSELWQMQQDGWLLGCRHVLSPNSNTRPDGSIELLVIHNISLPPEQFEGDGIEQFFTNTLDRNAHPYYLTIPEFEVSAHFLIRRDGELIQFVSCLQRAWHAGLSNWQGRDRCNDFSIGIELEGSDNTPFSAAQYQVLIPLTRLLQQCYPIKGIAGHSHLAPQRKTDPGPYFDWFNYLRGLR